MLTFEAWRFPEGPSTQHVRTLVPKTVKGMVSGTGVLKYWVLGPSGFGMLRIRLVGCRFWHRACGCGS